MVNELKQVLQRLHYPLEVMLACVRWYAAYSLSLRHIEELMDEGLVGVKPQFEDYKHPLLHWVLDADTKVGEIHFGCAP